MKFESIKLVNPLSIAVGERIIAPAPKNVAAMTESLDRHGQLTPIVVMPVTTNTYRLVAGATRLEATIKLGWDKIRVEVVTGTELQYEAHEVLENLDRRDLTREQRTMLRKRKREIENKMFEAVQSSKGGRGKKGGVADVARQAGVTRTTAHRRQHENKPFQNVQSGTVSKPKNKKLGISASQSLRDFIDELWKAKNFPSLSETVCAILRGDAPNQREWIAEKKQHQPDADHLIH